MRNLIITKIKSCQKFFDQNFEIFDCKLKDHKISSSLKNGVYILYTRDFIMYVGRGSVADRLKTHVEKVKGVFTHAKDTKGFKKLRSTKNLELNEISVVYFDCNQPHISCAFEGALIYKLMPLANDDTYKIVLK